MKQALLWMFVSLALSGVASAQAAAAPAGSERMFFPHDMFWGYGQFDLAPPHNEIDPNICRADAGISGGVNAPCNAFARYMLSGYVEIRPFGRTQLRRFFLFGEPRFLFDYLCERDGRIPFDRLAELGRGPKRKRRRCIC